MDKGIEQGADRLGTVVAGLCSIHCLATPLLFALVPSFTLALRSFSHPAHAWAIGLLELSRWEWAIALCASLFALLSTGLGWGKHRRKAPFVTAGVGLALLMSAALWPALKNDVWLHTMAAVSGGALLVRAHLLNLQGHRQRNKLLRVTN